MKRPFLAAFFLLFLFACQPKRQSLPDAKAAEKALQDFFAAIANYDYNAVRRQCTDDFQLIEHGLHWNIDSLCNGIRSLEGKARIAYTLDDIATRTDGPVAWTTYRNRGLMKMGNQQVEFEWVESAVFKKENDSWKIALLHSTRVKP